MLLHVEYYQTDGQSETIIPPNNFVVWVYNNAINVSPSTPVLFCGTDLRAISQEMLMNFNTCVTCVNRLYF